MSDHVDNTDKIIYAEVARGLAAVRRRPGLVVHGCCHYCDEALAPALLFCGVDCATTTTRSKRPRRAPAAQDDRHAALIDSARQR